MLGRTTLAAILALGLALAVAPATAQVTVKFASFVPPQSFAAKQVLEPFARAVEQDAGGEVKIEPYWGGSLGRDPFKQYALVTEGITDIGFVQPEYSSGQFPDDSLFEMPYLLRSAEEGSVAMWRFHKQGHSRGYGDIQVLGMYMTSLLAIHSRKPITKAEDLKGLKIRSSGKISTEYLKAVGAVPVGVAATEVTESVSRGVLDAAMTNWVGLVTFRTHNVVTDHFIAPLGSITFIIPMHKRTWDKLGAKAKAAFVKHGGEALARHAGKAYDNGDREQQMKLREDGKRRFVTETPAEESRSRAAIKAIYDQWIAQTADGKKKFDAVQAILADIRAGR